MIVASAVAPTTFAALVWGSVLLVVVVFVYIARALVLDRQSA
ncbi:MAG: hypothetical protein ACI9TI_001221 [Natronomonas sp.]|jgi:hypothetical protein